MGAGHPHKQSALILVAMRPRHVAGPKGGTTTYLRLRECGVDRLVMTQTAVA